MITAVRAFEVAHAAIGGTRCHEAPCDVVIARQGDDYVVTLDPPGEGVAPDAPDAPAGVAPADEAARTRVVVDGGSGAVRDLRAAPAAPSEGRVAGMVSARRALEAAVAALAGARPEYDPHWTTTVLLRGARYEVTFPVAEPLRASPRRPDFAIQFWVDPRTAAIVGGLSAS